MAVDALKWISSLLIEKDIPFAVCGGLAAIGYGSTRPLNDIDIFVPGKYFQMVVSAGSEHISNQPSTISVKAGILSTSSLSIKELKLRLETRRLYESSMLLRTNGFR